MLDDYLLSPIFWDKKGYRFNRNEKDMYPYSIIKNENEMILVHNVLGIDKKDLHVKMAEKEGKKVLKINGKTENKITKNSYSVNSEFVLNISHDIKEIKSVLENGLLYITIKYEKSKEKDLEISID